MYIDDDLNARASHNYLMQLADDHRWPPARVFALAALLDADGTKADPAANARLIDKTIRARKGDPLAVGLDILSCAPAWSVVSRRGTDGRQLRITLPGYTDTKPREDEYGDYTARWLRFAGIDPDTPILWRHDPLERAVGRVLGVRHHASGDCDVWIEIAAGRRDLIERAIYGELSVSPRVVSTFTENEVTRDRVTGDRRIQFGVGTIREISLTDAGNNGLAVTVALDVCPASIRTAAIDEQRNDQRVALAMRDAEHGDMRLARSLGLVHNR